jgi:hypothetical protein
VTPAGLTPLAGATVEILGHNGTTNAQGYYRISGIESNGLRNTITVTKAGYKSETRYITLPLDAIEALWDIPIVSESNIHTLQGVVSERTSSGLVPVEGAVVTELSAAVPRSADNLLQRVTTDKNGYYRLPGLYAGTTNVVWVNKDGFADPFPPRPEASEGGEPVTMDGDKRLDIELVRR